MNSAKDRLELAEAVLAVIEEHRLKKGNENLGAAVERAVVEEELRGLTNEIFDNPGVLETQLVPVRRRRAA